MGQPADLSSNDRAVAHHLADLVWTQIENDETLPPIGDNRAWLLAGEIRLQRAELELANAAWSTTCEAVDARIAELEEQLAISEVNTTAIRRENAELLVKLQSVERSYARLREEASRG